MAGFARESWLALASGGGLLVAVLFHEMLFDQVLAVGFWLRCSKQQAQAVGCCLLRLRDRRSRIASGWRSACAARRIADLASCLAQ